VRDIISLSDYCVVVFPSTSQALKAEKVLKSVEAEFVMMPTPREISTSCGLAVKFRPQKTDEYCQVLAESQVLIEGVYHISRDGKRAAVVKIFPQG